MCGIAGIFGRAAGPAPVQAMVTAQHHRGPDDRGVYLDPLRRGALGHTRLAIIDPTPAGRGPMAGRDGRFWLSFNGELYNYVELRRELHEYPYRSETDTEVVLAAYERWGPACLERFLGMFALLLWDEQEGRLFAARDRFGVKPLIYAPLPAGGLALASEARALHAAGVPAHHDEVAWATYLTTGLHDHGERTFWAGVRALPPGHWLTWEDGRTATGVWYDVAGRIGTALDERPEREVAEDCVALLEHAVGLRFRSDVPVGINLSGGLDSSLLFRLTDRIAGGRGITAFTFVTGDPRYDELPWVRAMTDAVGQELVVCRLDPEDVPGQAARVQRHQDGPFGGLPTLAYARLFESAREAACPVLLDGQGLDEQWAGYDYYTRLNGHPRIVQAAGARFVRPECLRPDFRRLEEPFAPPEPFPDAMRNLQYRDIAYTKLPRGMRFNDRISMQASVELREPFLDHRLFELALRQPEDRRVRHGERKWLLRELDGLDIPSLVRHAPKRPLQTPQREWLRGPLAGWAEETIEAGLATLGRDWFDADTVRREWREYKARGADNSFFAWQWINVGLAAQAFRADDARNGHRNGAVPVPVRTTPGG
jgi:asparagine synthase (glutamine-hydrolysing)